MPALRRFAVIFAADVAGYSRLIRADEEGTLKRLKALRAEVIDPKIAEHRGPLVKTTGDELRAEFVSVVGAMRCAVAWQAAMSGRAAAEPAESRTEFRLGDIIIDVVNIAARRQGRARRICISRTVLS
jgi:adenylate cyclase